MQRKCTLLWQGAFLPTSSAAAPAFLAMALIWSSFIDAGTETVDIRESGGAALDVGARRCGLASTTEVKHADGKFPGSHRPLSLKTTHFPKPLRFQFPNSPPSLS